ncbi:hypothetical protein NUKP28_01090 [Klebsiella quasipneumoniae]|jgi:hypothetical protein|nr:hypothetical protein NUKP28_01090 [Klebsiella quasipneumoniae]
MRGCFVGWRFAYPTYDSCDLPLIYPLAATETAGAGGLKIAETFPEGRGYRGRGDWPPPVRSLRHE